MEPDFAMLFLIAFLLFLSSREVSTRTSNFKHKKDEHLKLSHHQYLISTKCRTTVQCAVACLSAPGCDLADVDSGNLYKRSKENGRETQIIRNYVKPRENNAEEPGPEKKDIDYFFIVLDSRRGYKARDVYKVSVKSNTSEKTGITIKGNIHSITYDRKSKTFFWSENRKIFKQVVEFNSKKIKTSCKKGAYDLNIYNEKLFYRINLAGSAYIYTNDLIKLDKKHPWISIKKYKISHFVINGNIACWLQCGRDFSIKCVEVSTKNPIYVTSQFQGCIQLSTLALLKTSNFGLLVYSEYVGDTKNCINVVEISGGQFGKPKSVTYFYYKGEMKIVPGFLFYSVSWFNKVEIWEIGQNGSFGRMTFSTHYPLSKHEGTVLVALI